ncbi:leucine-rich repeat neuronal protein 2-like [Adelges cooleyi]|uniref:leucine-rich repeat neuronal protein 2-like n=1 Tax=Adelges cooleyi TaxID=133065 RepID=UPI00218024FD|nr:leucine-rich repeat neuronal protein 2-like [Adelges cooleyi]
MSSRPTQELFISILIIAILIRNVVSDGTQLCDTCTCTDFSVNCSDKGQIEILNLWNHEVALSEAVIIHFDYNNIVHVQQLPPSKVKYLSLQHNRISKIDDFAFANLHSLIDLDLSYNALTPDTLDSNIFKTNQEAESTFHTSLKHLNLNNNGLHSLRANTFKDLSTLSSLTLAGNPFKVIDRSTSFALSSLPFLKNLDLTDTSLENLPEHFLHTPRYLESLNLSKNMFNHVPRELAEAHMLRRLDLSYNPIQNISNFPKMSWLKILHLSHMPNLNTIDEHAFSLLTNLEEFYCSHNLQLHSIAPNAFSYEAHDGSEGEQWPHIVKLYLNHNSLGYLDSRLLSRWDTLQDLNLQGNKWICDCENQWLVSTLAPMVEARHAEFLKDFTCQEPIEMRGVSILDLDHRHYHLRCLDFYNHRPERDGVLLVGILIGVILSVPFTMAFMMYCARKKNSLSYYHRMLNFKGPLPHEFQLRETPVYQPTSINVDGY